MKNNNIDNIEEKNNIQLSGKVSATMKAFIENMPETTFAGKIRSLIDSYSVIVEEKSRLKIDRIQNLEENLKVMKTNIEAIEQECNLYVNQVEENTKEKIEDVIKMAMEQEGIRIKLADKEEAFDKLSIEKQELVKKLEKSEIDIKALEKEVEILKNTKLDLTNMNTELNKQNVDLVAKENAALKEIERLKENHNKEIEILKQELLNTKDELKSTVADAKANKELLESKLENVLKGNEDLKVQVKEVKELNGALSGKVEELNLKLQDIGRENIKLDTENKDKVNEINSLKDTLGLKENEFNQKSKKVIELDKEITKLSVIVENANKDIEKVSKENDSLKEEIKNKNIEVDEFKTNIITLSKDLEVEKNNSKQKDIDLKDLKEEYKKEIDDLKVKIVELEKINNSK